MFRQVNKTTNQKPLRTLPKMTGMEIIIRLRPLASAAAVHIIT